MINKFKDIGRRGLSLGLAISMMMPTGVYAGNHSVGSWDGYKNALITDIMKQDTSITINFSGNEIFSTEYFARLKIADVYEDVLKDIPKYLGELNIISETTIPELDGVLNAQLNKVTHQLEYNNSSLDFANIKQIISGKYNDIRKKVTDYEKIKTAYDYIVLELEDEERDLYKLLSAPENFDHDTYHHAVLFALMMTELGYDNDIAIGEDGHKWNLVKLHGKWYHVDASQEEIKEENNVGDNHFLITLDPDKWNSTDHTDKVLADKEYNRNPYTVPQIQYEIALIMENIPKGSDLGKIPEMISIDYIRDIKEEIASLNGRIKDYIERVELLKAEVARLMGEAENESSFDELNENLNRLGDNLNSESTAIETKKDVIVISAVEQAKDSFALDDIATAIEAADMLKDNSEKEKMIALHGTITTIERAERTRTELDIDLAKRSVEDSQLKEDLRNRLEQRILVLETRIAVDIAGRTLDNDDIGNAEKLIVELEDGEIKENFSSRLDDIKKQKEANETEQNHINIARVAVESVEALIRNSTDTEEIAREIGAAEEAIESVKTESIVIQFKDRIDDVKIAKNAIGAVNDAKACIDIKEGVLLSSLVSEAETKVKIAEDEIEKIKTKDRDVRTGQQDRIKTIKLVISALKAVDKAENALKATNVKSARTAIAKVSREYKVEMDALEVRLVLVEFKINSQSAIKLIEKAESSLKRADYNKAKAAVDKLIEGEMGEGYDPGTYTGSYRDLVLRLEDVEYVILAKEAVENAEKLMNANKETLDVYEKAIADVRTIYNTSLDDYDEGFNKKFGSLLTDLNNRISAMDDAIKAMKDLSLTEQIYQGYLAKENTPRKVRELIDRTEKAINDLIESNNSGKLNSRVISSLQSRLKVVSDGLSEDEKYYEVSLLLESLEKSIIDTQGGLKQEAGKTLEETIATIDQEMAKIIEATNDVKNKARKKDIQDRTTAINNVLAAYRAVEVAEKSDIKNLSTNIKKANTAVGKLSTDGIYENIENIGQYIKVLENRISKKEKAVETADNVAKAIAAVDKAEMTKNEKDTKGAIDAVAKLKGNPEVEDIFTDQKNQIRDIISDLIEIANDAVNTTISSIRRKNDNKLVNKNYTNASKAIGLADNITYQASTLLEIIQDKTGEPYELQIKNLDEILSVLDLSLEALRAVEEAEKNRTQSNVDLANEAIKLIPNEDESVEPKKYKEMKEALKARVDYVYSLLESQRTLESTANNLIAQAEELMINYLDAREVPKDLIMRQAQEAVNGVTDKSKKADFQKRINNINSAMLAISAVDFAKGFTDEKTVKDAEKALSNLVKTGSYLDIATDLNSQIGQLKDKLNIEKLVADAEELVLKAIKSRTIEDIRRAEFALVRIKEHDEAAHDRLFVMLTELNESLGKEAEDEIAATEAAKKAIADARDLINGSDEVEGVNGLILDIIASIKELRVAIKDKDKDRENYVKVLLQEAYGKTKAASDLISKAGYEVLKLSNKNNQKTLQEQIKFVNEEIALAEDNIDVQEATRLLTIASYLVAEAKTEQDRHMAGLAIGDTRRAINDIGHKKNSDVKKTIIAQVNSIEKRLSINNDEVFIAEAVDAVNKAADELANSVIANKVTENQRDIEMAIWDAELAIILISDNNREAKEMLKSFLNDISVMFEAEKAGIQNAQRIINAEEAVEYAEKEYEAKSDKVEAAIRTARLRIRMIRTDGQDAEEAIAKIEELTSRLDRLEGKTGGSGGNGSDGKKPVGNSNSKAPDSDYARVKENTDPLWGGSKKLNKTNPTPDTTNSEMIELRIKDSKVSIVDAAKKLKTTKNLKVSLVAKGRNIDSGASAYRLDSVNNNILLPIMPLAKGLGFSVEMDGGSTSTRLIINTLVNGESKRATINMNTARYYVDGRSISVKTKPILEDGIAYIPIDFLVEYLGLSFSHYIQGSNIQMIIN